MKKRASGFTLVEILVVLAIIAILAALIFPAFNRAKEGSKQNNCQTNLQQIGLAVAQYRKDEGRYPSSLLDLLPAGTKFDDGSATGSTISDKTGTTYLSGGQSALKCPDDDTTPTVPRSSYGSLNNSAPSNLASPVPSGTTSDLSRYVWNFWGYRADGFAYATEAESAGTNNTFLVNSSATYARNLNPIKYSMANRFAPPSTIITHCIYHRVPTANGLGTPGDLYSNPDDSGNARDVILRLDGSAKSIDVSLWQSQGSWQSQTP